MNGCKPPTSDGVASNEAGVRFETLLPTIQRTIAFAFRRVQRARRVELIAAAVARAYEMYARLVERGKTSLAYATALANYAIKQVRSGRSTGNKQNVRDVLSPWAQRQKCFSVISLTTECLAECRRADPAELAALRIDFATWISRLCPLKRSVALFLAVGHGTNDAARRFGVSVARISQIRRELRAAWSTFQSNAVA